MKVTLKSYPSMDADLLCGEAAAICYAGTNPERSLERSTGSGHLSVIEHACFTFRIDDVSRVLLAQLTRHRIASESVESQRYVRYEIEPEWIIPPSINERPVTRREYLEECHRCFELYKLWLSRDVEPEDARFIFPGGTPTRLFLTMNARELCHFFTLRCCNRAQWEIRELACRMLEEVRIVAPAIFKAAGPACVRGACPEGAMSCGKPWKECRHDY